MKQVTLTRICAGLKCVLDNTHHKSFESKGAVTTVSSTGVVEFTITNTMINMGCVFG